MFKHKHFFQQGISLLELMLVLCIAAVILVMGMRFYLDYEKSRNITLFENSIAQLAQALNNYYYGNCNNNNINNISVGLLEQQGLISSKLYNPWGSFFVKIINTNNNTAPFYVLQVGAEINAGGSSAYNFALANFIRGALNADGVPESG